MEGVASDCGCDDITNGGATEGTPTKVHLTWKISSFLSSMSHNSHGHCNDEHQGHDHDHDHTPESQGSDNLYSFIDHSNVRILNAVDDAKILKPWDQRLDESVVSTGLV